MRDRTDRKRTRIEDVPIRIRALSGEIERKDNTCGSRKVVATSATEIAISDISSVWALVLYRLAKMECIVSIISTTLAWLLRSARSIASLFIKKLAQLIDGTRAVGFADSSANSAKRV